ncbi:hypothetical protein D3H65_05990 [Paraflavitalea soli]|uniref:SMI1/KNR4 family protein n=1 Tax=Paraflavitalea soli TaxID=2315862 RepID=A0A3B7MKJ3_9BACT|nr:hypothetical protein [Paraflavitalea soli]AXY73556.1 hypothetical protein D3H65_05990 [Paraflavitalea soli]
MNFKYIPTDKAFINEVALTFKESRDLIRAKLGGKHSVADQLTGLVTRDGKPINLRRDIYQDKQPAGCFFFLNYNEDDQLRDIEVHRCKQIQVFDTLFGFDDKIDFIAGQLSHMTLEQIEKYWTDRSLKLNKYQLSQLNIPRLLSTTKDYLIYGGLPDSCAPGLSFEACVFEVIPSPNEVFNIDLDELDDYLMIGSNDSGDPICIDLIHENEVVFLNHDNDFESVFMNSSIQQLVECMIRYNDFNASLNPRFENNTFLQNRFTDNEFATFCNDLQLIDLKSLLDNSFWKTASDCFLLERDNQ